MFAVMLSPMRPVRLEPSARMEAVSRRHAARLIPVVLVVPVKCVWAAFASTSLAQPRIQVVCAQRAIPVLRALVCRALARLRRPRVLAAAMMPVESVWKVFAVITCAVSISPRGLVKAEKSVMHLPVRLPVLFRRAVRNTSVAPAPVKTKFVLAGYVPCLLAVKTF